ncbi:thioredoxin-related transmembrane protein 4 isoform X2 [Malaclemys terrapin pileata]|uniref:thioredoxin-related transmembrane protein 4 isoform X2 n=1 Tax=Malaclemys terrapin pileata TaxID=2991368 RepID=UPI0023A8CEB4|nr:thioredoxin-related transmembrane protein 4 isoform X2 [Malaclemys terrapin pileata]
MAAGARRAGLGAAGTALLAAGLALALSPSEVGSPGEQRGHVRVLSAANWSLVLQGQWMVQFYAPWCPACQQIEAAWENFAKGSEHLDITIGKVDVTQEPGLSGRFFVTTLPTIYHAKDGVFRRYRGSRTSEDLRGYILERKWEAVEPVAGWKSPSSIMMHGMAGLFHFSGWIRQIHSYFTGTLGIHVWGSYAIFILSTLLIGLILGLILVLIADCLCPSKRRYREETSELIERENAELTAVEEVEEAEEFSANELEEAAEEKEDISDGEDGAKSSEEANSSEDGSEEDSAVDEGSGTEETEDICEQQPIDSETQSSVRQRKSQVADNGL